jgi:hypothetical protein
VDDDTGQLVVKIIDRSTKEVIRQMPSEEMLAIAKTLDSIKGCSSRRRPEQRALVPHASKLAGSGGRRRSWRFPHRAWARILT